ncbi:hypothetical protein TFLX_02336 [Thermoflexales bacterium]|nr:hypothetical protein TFLX_02336 [Thermoflexales bacterium]
MLQLKRLGSTVIWCLGMMLSLFSLLSTAHAAPTLRYVATSGYNTGIGPLPVINQCTDNTKPCRTVQWAVNRSNSGDEIRVATGVYTGVQAWAGVTQSVYLSKTITIRGGYTTTDWLISNPIKRPTVLDAEGKGRVFYITGKAAPTLEGLRIVNGSASDLRGDPNSAGDPDRNDAGGGIYSHDASPLIVNNVISGNNGCDGCSTYGRGGGIYLFNAPATALISGNLIVNNQAANTILGWGGGVALRESDARVVFNTIAHNQGGTVGDGGGIYILDGSPTIADNLILTNTAGTGVLCNGGGLFARSSTPITIERNLFQDNRALFGTGVISMPSTGGGLYFNGARVSIRDNVFRSNTAATSQAGLGGGLYLSNLAASSRVSGNHVFGNNRASYGVYGDGGGLYLNQSQATVAHNTVFNNIASSSDQGAGGGVYVNGGGGLLHDNVITGNLAMLGAVSDWGYGGGVAISNSVVTLRDNRIVENLANSAPGNASGVGGGLWIYLGAPQIIGNEISGNTSGAGSIGLGGGLYAEETQLTIDRNTIQSNRATGDLSSRGGGVRLNHCTPFTLTNNIVAHNVVSQTGSGVAIVASAGQLAHNTIAANDLGDDVGVSVSSGSQVTLTNNLIANQAVGISQTGAILVMADYTLFDNNGANYNTGVTSAHEVPGPAALTADYHLQSSSNAIDHGTPLIWVTLDVDDDPRLGLPDVGADERVTHVWLPVVLRQ